MLAAVAAALAACGTGLDVATAPTTVSLTMKVGDYPSLATPNGVVFVSANSSPIAVVRTGASSFVALSRICPHQGATVGQASFGFQCPRHGAQFNTVGQWIGGQPTGSMHGYSAQYDATTDILTIG